MRRNAGRPIILPTAQKNLFARRNNSPPVGVSFTSGASRATGERAALGCPFQEEEVRDMACLRATVLATTAVGLMALATPALAEVIMTPDGHYYKL
jgi:hypothetical protein